MQFLLKKRNQNLHVLQVHVVSILQLNMNMWHSLSLPIAEGIIQNPYLFRRIIIGHGSIVFCCTIVLHISYAFKVLERDGSSPYNRIGDPDTAAFHRTPQSHFVVSVMRAMAARIATGEAGPRSPSSPTSAPSNIPNLKHLFRHTQLSLCVTDYFPAFLPTGPGPEA